MKKLQSSVTIVIVGLLVLPVFVYANSPSSNLLTPEQQQKRQEAQSNVKSTVNSEEFQQRARARCQTISNRLQSHGSTYEIRLNKRADAYEKVVVRLESLDAQLQEEGVDTTDLKALISDLQVVLDEYQTEVQTYLLNVEDIGTAVCTSENVQELLTDLRADLKEVIASSEEVKDFIMTKVIPYLNTL